MRLLAIGDVYGTTGQDALRRWLPGLITETGASAVVVNAENLHRGRGVHPAGARDVFELGAHVLTAGNHVWGHKEHARLLEREARVLRPANMPEPCPGEGVALFTNDEGLRIAVMSLIGRIFMTPVDCPFHTADQILDELREQADIIVVDMHAEATSEKLAMARHLDGRVSAVWGTHTHVQTADARVLPGGTGFITDLGMTGPYDSIIGAESEAILERFRSGRPVRAEPAEGSPGLRGALFEIDEGSGLCRGVERVARGEGGA